MNNPPLFRSVHYNASADGPKIIVLGAVHGNEPCGTQAIYRLMSALDQGEINLLKGQLTLIPITNPLAWEKRSRMGERNLNRNFRRHNTPQDYEDRLCNQLAPLLEEHDVLLDLHSFHTPGKPFVMLGPRNNKGELEAFSFADKEQDWASRLGVERLLEGWLETYARGVARRTANPNASSRAQMLSTDPGYGVGTTEYVRSHGGYALTLECGQHDDPKAPEMAYDAICKTLAHFDLLALPKPGITPNIEILRLVDVIDRDHEEDVFTQEWRSFDSLVLGDVIGRRYDGNLVTAPMDGFIVFPNPNALPGNEWFYLATHSDRARYGT